MADPRPIHRATSSLDIYSDEEREFGKAMDWYKRKFHRPFPSWPEVLAVAHFMGYRKVAEEVGLPKHGR